MVVEHRSGTRSVCLTPFQWCACGDHQPMAVTTFFVVKTGPFSCSPGNPYARRPLGRHRRNGAELVSVCEKTRQQTAASRLTVFLWTIHDRAFD
jgi:hypothetical protein